MGYIKNIDPNGERILPDLNLIVGQGETAEVSDEAAASLAEQGAVWQRVNQDGSPYVAPVEAPPAPQQEQVAEPAKAEEAK